MDVDWDVKPDNDDLERQDRAIRCAFCGSDITNGRHTVERSGAWKHVFTNPAGYVYEIGCYGLAPGCQILGEYNSDFSWFKGYLWTYALCNGCYHHLGWHFSGPSTPDFYGLILKYLES